MKTITDTLRHIGDGFLIDSATDKMAELVKAVNETGRQGKLTLTITVKKTTKGGAMHITGEPKLTLPRGELMETVLFSTEDGELTQDHPHQQSMDLVIVKDSPNSELKQISEDK